MDQVRERENEERNSFNWLIFELSHDDAEFESLIPLLTTSKVVKILHEQI